jgi:acyl-CoA synthetase (AMP-forming)/AMP-acid ligase II
MAENLWTISLDDTQPSPDQKPTNALPGFKYKVVDENGDEIEGDFERTGQLCVMGPTAMTRYLMKDRETSEKATKQVIRGTWVYTGDLATLDGAGETLRITYRCRKDESLFQEGVYVYPDKVDKAYRGGPGIQDIAGFVTKNIQGKKILACAIVRDPGPAVERIVLDWCKGKAVGDARPAAFVFVDAIPYTPAGNVNRLSLGRLYSGIQ